MNIVFLCSLICLGSSISVRDKQLSPLKKITNKSLITSAVTSSDLVKVIMDHKKDPEYLLGVLSNVDPTKLNDVLLLVRALLAASEADLVVVTQISTAANTAYTDATTAYDAAVVARVDLQGTKTAFDLAFTANSALLDQQVAALLVAQTEAHGAKTNAQSTFDTETARLNGEIETLKQVITLLESLVGSTAVSNSVLPMFNFDAGNVGECPPGWTCSASFVMVEDCANQLCPNVDGLFFRVGNDGDVGWADSDVFRLPTNTKTLRFQRCGGADAGSGLYVILQSTESIVCSAENGANTDNFFTDECDLSGYGGQNVHIKVVDAVNGGWGKTWLKDIEFLDGSGAILEA